VDIPEPVVISASPAVSARLEHRTALAAWEGGGIELAQLDGRPVFLLDEGTLADFLPPEERAEPLRAIYCFDDLEARSRFLRSRGYPATPAEARGWRLEHALVTTQELEELDALLAASAAHDPAAAKMRLRVRGWLEERSAANDS
jgi:hypothetical protein